MNRSKFQPMTFLLVNSQVVQNLVRLLHNLPVDADRPLEVVIREPVRQRGLDQNGYYWHRLGEISEQGWLNGRQFDSYLWHEYAKIHLMPDLVTTKDGIERSKWMESPDGSLAVISTTLLEKGCFAQYTQLVEIFGAQELGVRFSVSPNEGRNR